MITYRSFLNTDPPLIAKIWQSQAKMDGQIQELPPLLCEQNIFGKPYFDPDGLIVAFAQVGDQMEAVGYVHASFSSNEDGSDLDYSQGIVCALKVIEFAHTKQVANQLLLNAMGYLRGKGATHVYAGACFPHSPFYLGLYGGSEVPGVLESDVNFVGALQRQEFSQLDRVDVWRQKLPGFRPVGGREQLAIRRKYRINAVADSPPQSWWENCTLGMAMRERFTIFDKQNQIVCGHMSCWDMKPLVPEGTLARGIYGLNVSAEFRRSGIATYLICETLKQLMRDGVEWVEAQTRESELAASGLLQKIGFTKMHRGLLMAKSFV